VTARIACGEPLRVEAASARLIMSFGIRSHAGSVSSLLNERLDQLLVSAFLGPVQLGLYAIAVTVTSVTSLVGSAVSPVAAAQIAHLQPADAHATARRLVSFTFWASLAVTLPLVLFAPALIGLCFGHAYASVAFVAQILLVAAIFLSTNRTLTAVLNGLGRPLDAAKAEGLAVVCTVVLLATLLPTVGLLGAGIASVAAYGISSVWMVLHAGRALGIRPFELLVPEPGDVRRALAGLRPARVPVQGAASGAGG
jgi:O-antigen/teichoic acid export membrane protein